MSISKLVSGFAAWKLIFISLNGQLQREPQQFQDQLSSYLGPSILGPQKTVYIYIYINNYDLKQITFKRSRSVQHPKHGGSVSHGVYFTSHIHIAGYAMVSRQASASPPGIQVPSMMTCA